MTSLTRSIALMQAAGHDWVPVPISTLKGLMMSAERVAELAGDYEKKRQRWETLGRQNTTPLTAEERVESTKAYHVAQYEMIEARKALDAAKGIK